MNIALISALTMFAFVSSITPGPNNIMLMTSGANFGVRRTLPHLMGVNVGFILMIGLVGVGLMQIFEVFPALQQVLRVISVVYLLYLAWKIANAEPPAEATAGGEPLTFLQAAAFQWVNPKAWAMSLTALSAYAPDHTFLSIAIVAAVFGTINMPSICLWMLLGVQLRRFLTTKIRLRVFNGAMALLLVASIPAIFLADGPKV